jgi:hypothetical protein
MAAYRGAPPLLWRGMRNRHMAPSIAQCTRGSAHCHVAFWQPTAAGKARHWLYISCSLGIALMADDSRSGTPPGTEDTAALSEAAIRDIVRREVSAAVAEALRSGPSPSGPPVAGQWQYYSGFSAAGSAGRQNRPPSSLR